MARSCLAWHFLPENGRTRYSDLPVVVGDKMIHTGEIKLCESGLHASRKLTDALKYAPGPILCRVRLSGQIKHGDDKSVASERTALWKFDASRVLRLWACWCIRNTKLADGRTTWDLLTDERSRNAVEVAELFANGKSTKEKLAAARHAAWDAARHAARDAARDAARHAARDAAWHAAWDAAWGAAWHAAGAAARDAARDAAGAAARDAAWDAARDAARHAATNQLETMVMEEAKRIGLEVK